MHYHVKWYTRKTLYVDLDTGEEITKYNALKHYKHVKTETIIEYNANKTIGFRTHIFQFRNKYQQEINFGNDQQ